MKTTLPFLVLFFFGSSCVSGHAISALKPSGRLYSAVIPQSHSSNPIDFWMARLGDARFSKSAARLAPLQRQRHNDCASGPITGPNPSGKAWTLNPSSRSSGASGGLGLEEYLRNSKKDLSQPTKSVQPQGISKDDLVVWGSSGMAGLSLFGGGAWWFFTRIRIPPCPKCNNDKKKLLRIGEKCRTPSNFWVKCYCDACGYKWIQKGRRPKL